MKTVFRISDLLLQRIHADLNRPHPFAAERIGFLTCGVADLPEGMGLYGATYHPVADEDYEPDHRVGAMLGAAAFRKILQVVYRNPATVMHVHRHDHYGRPSPSYVDRTESKRFVPDFWKVCPNHPHGTLLLSLDDVSGNVWLPTSRAMVALSGVSIVGDSVPLKRGTLNE